MTGVFEDIESAFQMKIISTLAAAGVAVVDLPGTPATPTAGTPWARLTNLPAATYVAGVGIDSPTVHPGAYQVSLFYPLNKGQKAVLGLAAALCTVFKQGTYLSQNGAKILILGSSRGPFVPDVGWLHLPITIRWRSEHLDS
jgi:hypothetical protein